MFVGLDVDELRPLALFLLHLVAGGEHKLHELPVLVTAVQAFRRQLGVQCIVMDYRHETPRTPGTRDSSTGSLAAAGGTMYSDGLYQVDSWGYSNGLWA